LPLRWAGVRAAEHHRPGDGVPRTAAAPAHQRRGGGLHAESSTGDDLDNIAANLDTERLTITEATDTTDAVMESDEALRLRAQAAFEGMSVAGPSAAYEYFARSASGKVAAVRATSPSPAEVVIAILSSDGDGTPSAELIATVQAVNDEDTRPLGDRDGAGRRDY
jgi:phage-related baseplate assembly protein